MQISVNLQRVADFGKSANGRGEFLQAHVGNCPVADLKKSAYPGGNSACRFQQICSEWHILENLQMGGISANTCR